VAELLTTAVLVESREARGVMDAFHGDHFTVTFNCVAPCAMHASRAVGVALAIGRRTRRACEGQAWPTEDQQLLDGFRLTAGVASGPARLGDFGCADAKRFMTIGPVVPTAAALERYIRRHPREGQWTPTPDNAYRVAVPGGLMEDLRTSYVCECVDVAALPMVPHTLEASVAAAARHAENRALLQAACRAVPYAVAQVIRERSGGAKADEWMYVVGSDNFLAGGDAPLPAMAGGAMPPATGGESVTAGAAFGAFIANVADVARGRWAAALDALARGGGGGGGGLHMAHPAPLDAHASADAVAEDVSSPTAATAFSRVFAENPTGELQAGGAGRPRPDLIHSPELQAAAAEVLRRWLPECK
jgi:hypothetical protein